jgi:hypothetical protein
VKKAPDKLASFVVKNGHLFENDMRHSTDVRKHNPKRDLATHQQSRDTLIANIIQLMTNRFL